MKGTRPLDNDEIRVIFDSFTGDYEKRDRGLFLLGDLLGAVKSMVAMPAVERDIICIFPVRKFQLTQHIPTNFLT